VLDQRLLRDDPERVGRELARRGLRPDIAALQGLALREKECEGRRSELQAEGNRIGREVGQRIREGVRPDDPAIQELREQGNAIKRQVADLEQEKRPSKPSCASSCSACPTCPPPSPRRAAAKPTTWR